MKSNLSRQNIAAVRLGVASLVVWVATAATVALGAITNVVETGGDNEATDTITAKWSGTTWPVSIANEPIPGATVGGNYTVGLFGHQAPTFVDRNHRYSDHLPASGTPADFKIPAYLVGQQYIMSGNDNRDNANYRLDVTVDTSSTAYMLVDNRMPNDKPNGTPPVFGAGAMQWILDDAWTPTSNGLNRMASTAVPDEVPVDEGADNTINQWYSVYQKTFNAGTFSLFQPDNPGRNMYGVVVVPSGPPPVLGDVNGNMIGGEFPADFDPIRMNFRKTVSGRTMGDLNADNKVDFVDFRQWKAAHLGMGGSLAGLDLGIFGVPEPTTALLIVLGMASIGAVGRPRRDGN